MMFTQAASLLSTKFFAILCPSSIFGTVTTKDNSSFYIIIIFVILVNSLLDINLFKIYFILNLKFHFFTLYFTLKVVDMTQKVDKISLDGTWILRNSEKSVEIDAQVPGTVFESLIEKNIIEDPFYGEIEHEMKVGF